MPTYDSENYIKTCIDSILEQSYQNYEIIIIDNQSSDGTLNIINSYKSEKIKFFSIQNKGQVSLSRNLGIKNAQGDWLAFLDSDDYWYKDKLMHIMKNFSSKYDFIFHDMDTMIENKFIKQRPRLKKNIPKKNLIEYLLVNGNPIANSSVIVKKYLLESIGYIAEEQPSFTIDYHTWLKISLVSQDYYHCNKTFGVYRTHKKNLSSQVSTSKYYFKILNHFKNSISRNAYKKALGYYSYLKFCEIISTKNKSGFYTFFKRSMNLSTIKIKIKTIIEILLSIFK